MVEALGFSIMDHLTNNVEKGTMTKWADFYKDIFGVEEVRYCDIHGLKTGLQSYALRSPDGSFCIPINEATDPKSQIAEYLEEYKGPGVQHIAFLTDDIIKSVAGIQKAGIVCLDIDNEYYEEVFERLPNVTEDRKKLQDLQILVDGDEEGYLLQIFTKNVIGPIFIEIIQRKGHLSFGEGNFGALFRSIERDQQKRGYLD
jgi:4-hydroxyphenylpyruvate dioxygenase